jgi:hypothetical protein
MVGPLAFKPHFGICPGVFLLEIWGVYRIGCIDFLGAALALFFVCIASAFIEREDDFQESGKKKPFF